MRKCNKCEREYADELDLCPNCGQTYTALQNPQNKPVVDNEKSSIMSKKCAKLAQFEAKRHVIQNALILIFSLILFVSSFFIGVRFEFTHPLLASQDRTTANNSAIKFPIRLNTLQFIEGASAITYSREQADAYLRENLVNVKFTMTVANCLELEDKIDNSHYDTLWYVWSFGEEELNQAENKEEICLKIGEELSKSDVNYLKVFLCYNNMNAYRSIPTDCYIGVIFGFFVLALELCIMISSFVFSIIALVALIKNEQLKKPLLCTFLPLVFVLIALVFLSINFAYTMTSVFIAVIVVSVLSVVTLAVYKWLFEESAKTFRIAKLCKNLTLLAIGLAACFSAFGAWFTLEYVSLGVGQNAITVGAHELIQFIENVECSYQGQIFTLVDDAATVFAIMTYVFYTGAITSLITVVLAVCQRLHNNKPNMLLVRSIMSLIMSVISIIFIFAIKGRYDDIKYHNDLLRVNIILGMSLFISITLCIALIVVDAAWKVKIEENDNGKGVEELSGV